MRDVKHSEVDPRPRDATHKTTISQIPKTDSSHSTHNESRRLVLCQTSVCTPSAAIPGPATATRAIPPPLRLRPPPPPPPQPTSHLARTRAHHPCPCAHPSSTPPPQPQPRLPPPLPPLPFLLLRGGTRDGGGMSMVMGSLRKRRRCLARVSVILVSCMMMGRMGRKRVGLLVLRGYMMRLRRCVACASGHSSYDLTGLWLQRSALRRGSKDRSRTVPLRPPGA
jgi:hypothetical protein